MEVKKELITPSGSVNTKKVMEWIKEYMKPKNINPSNESKLK